jgi:hypothetical protein
MAKRKSEKMTNKDLQNTTQIPKDRATRTLMFNIDPRLFIHTAIKAPSIYIDSYDT